MQEVPFTHFAPKIHVPPAKCEPNGIVPLLQKWMRFRLFWPRQSLTPEVLAQNLKLYYVPCWSIDWMEASGTWFGKFRYEIKADGGSRTCDNCKGSGRQYLGGGVGDCKECGGSGQHKVTVTVEKEDFGTGEMSVTVRNLLLPRAKEFRALFETTFEKDWTKTLPTDVTELNILEPDTSQSPEASAQLMAEDILMKELKETATKKFEKKYEVSSVKDAKELSVLNAASKLGMVTAIAYPTYVGTYTHDGKEYGIQIDAYRSKACVEMPDSIMEKYKWVRRGLYVIVAALVVSLLFSCGTLYNVAMHQRSDAESLPWLFVVIGIVVIGMVILYWASTLDERVS